jgi:hypothetical protein
MPILPSELEAIDAQISAQLDLLRHEKDVSAQIIRLIEKMRKELIAKLSEGTLTEFGKQRVNKLIKSATETIDDYYSNAQSVLFPTLEGAAQVTAKSTIAGLPEAITAAIPSATVLETLVSNLLIEGAPSAAWWKRQSQDTAFKFANVVRQGIVQGETNEQIFRKVGEVTDLAGRNSRSLIHTSIMQAASSSREKTIESNKDIYKGYRQLSTLDGHTTPICIARSNLEWNFDHEPIGHNLPWNPPPVHWGCRSILMGVRKSFKELGIDISEPTGRTRASAEGQIDRDTSFDEFLKRRTQAQQDEQLGKGRAELWRSGKITLRQLLDNEGNTLTLEELKAKY